MSQTEVANTAHPFADAKKLQAQTVETDDARTRSRAGYQALPRAFVFGALLVISACATAPEASQEPTGPIEFVDIPGFDKRLSGFLAKPDETDPVEIKFIDHVSPNELPKRLQRWLAEVENSGGKIRVVQAPGELTPKDPLFLLSIVGGVLNGVKGLEYVREERIFKKAADYDADIQVKRSPETGAVVVDAVKFRKKESRKP